MEPHRLSLGQVSTHCLALAGAGEAATIGARLDQVIRNDLAAALSSAVAPVLAGHSGILRLRQLRIRLDLGDQWAGPGLADTIARRIAAALKTEIARGHATLRHWPDQEHYLAAYILMRLGMVAEPDWAFPDFANLAHLPPERAAAELIRARPALLAPLAHMAAAATGNAATPIAAWPAAAKAALVRTLVATPLEPAEADQLLPNLRQLLTTALPAFPRPLPEAELLAEALAFMLHVLAQGHQKPAPRAILIAIATTLATRARATASGTPQPPGQSSGTAADGEQETLRKLLALVRENPERRAVLDMLARPDTSRPVEKDKANTDGKQPAEVVPDHARLRSPRMGLALLLPSLLFLDAASHLTATRRARIVWQTLHPDDWQAASEDAALQILLPVDRREIDLLAPQPQPPEHLLRNLAPPARKRYEESPADLRWSALLLADFASRLRGLHASSHPYLRQQFLEHGGEVHRAKDSITVTLDRVPLGILLQMAGFSGIAGRLPQPGRPQLVLGFGGTP